MLTPKTVFSGPHKSTFLSEPASLSQAILSRSFKYKSTYKRLAAKLSALHCGLTRGNKVVLHSQHRESRRHTALDGRRFKRSCCRASSRAELYDIDYPPTGGRAFFYWLLDLPWKRVGVWSLVIAFAFQLKDFFGIAMGTFVLSFVGNSFVQSTKQNRFLFPSLITSERWRRRSMVLVYYTIIVSIAAVFGMMTIPSLIREGADFVKRLQSDSLWVVVLEKMRHGLGDGIMDTLEKFVLVASGDEMAGNLAVGAQDWTPERTSYLGEVLQKSLKGYTEAAVGLTTGLITLISRFVVQVGVSMVLSFMVVWDLPTISQGIQSLKTSRLSAMYAEVAPSVSIFGELFGRALQAQARIAAANTGLTALGMWALQLPGLGLLSMFVFLCSFIPIAGCFISTVPIGFVALTEYGFLKLALVIGMVVGIHCVEAYLLNPVIYASHLKLHPLMVLSVLVIAEHSLGVWGLLLAVPLTVFCLDYCIRYPACSLQEIAQRELQTVTSSGDFETRQDADGIYSMSSVQQYAGYAKSKATQD